MMNEQQLRAYYDELKSTWGIDEPLEICSIGGFWGFTAGRHVQKDSQGTVPRIDLNEKLVGAALINNEAARLLPNVLRHEVAHALVYRKHGNKGVEAHGAEWIDTCKIVGVDIGAQPTTQRLKEILGMINGVQ